jgi:hypothetical protein
VSLLSSLELAVSLLVFVTRHSQNQKLGAWAKNPARCADAGKRYAYSLLAIVAVLHVRNYKTNLDKRKGSKDKVRKHTKTTGQILVPTSYAHMENTRYTHNSSEKQRGKPSKGRLHR